VTFGPTTGELAQLKVDSRKAMPDTATIMRPTYTNGPGGQTPTFATIGTTPCRLTASVLSGGSEQMAAGQLASTVAYMLTVPADTDIQARDQIKVGTSTFEVNAGKRNASWNITDSYTLTEIRR
jgi:hypothetical protein